MNFIKVIWKTFKFFRWLKKKGIVPTKFQKKVLKEILTDLYTGRNRTHVIDWARQEGKTSVTRWLIEWTMKDLPDKRIAVFCPTRQMVEGIKRSIPIPADVTKPFNVSFHTAHVNSIIISKDVDIVMIDEAQDINEKIYTERIRPMVFNRNGMIIQTKTTEMGENHFVDM